MNGVVVRMPSKVYYEDCSIGDINAGGAGMKDYSFQNTHPKEAIWVADCSQSNRVGIIYMLNTYETTDTKAQIWYYNARNATANSCNARIFYTLA